MGAGPESCTTSPGRHGAPASGPCSPSSSPGPTGRTRPPGPGPMRLLSRHHPRHPAASRRPQPLCNARSAVPTSESQAAAQTAAPQPLSGNTFEFHRCLHRYLSLVTARHVEAWAVIGSLCRTAPLASRPDQPTSSGPGSYPWLPARSLYWLTHTRSESGPFSLVLSRWIFHYPPGSPGIVFSPRLALPFGPLPVGTSLAELLSPNHPHPPHPRDTVSVMSSAALRRKRFSRLPHWYPAPLADCVVQRNGFMGEK